jgi:hypothetical protein
VMRRIINERKARRYALVRAEPTKLFSEEPSNDGRTAELVEWVDRASVWECSTEFINKEHTASSRELFFISSVYIHWLLACLVDCGGD